MEFLASRYVPAATLAVLISLIPSHALYADSLPFGVVGSPIDLSANVTEAILPGGTAVFQASQPLFGTTADPVQSANLLDLAAKGVNASGRSINISGAFVSSLAESNGNGGVGVSQLAFGPPTNSSNQDAVSQLVAQSLWTQTFVYTGDPTIDMFLHLHIPALEVGLLGVPPNRSVPSATETAEARAEVDTVITHADGTFTKGGSFEFGLRLSEIQIFASPGNLVNFADFQVLENNSSQLFDSLHTNGDQFDPRISIDPVSTDVKVGTLQTGDTLSYVYTLTALGTTHGFERGFFAFLGDPFGADAIADNLSVSVALSDVSPPPPPETPEAIPEPGTGVLVMLGLTGLLVWSRRGFVPGGLRPNDC